MRKVRARNPAAALKDRAPWVPAAFEPADAVAVQACYYGTASEDQQKRAMNFLLAMSLNDKVLYFPGEDGRRDTDFALGRAFVGHAIISFIKMRRPDSEQG